MKYFKGAGVFPPHVCFEEVSAHFSLAGENLPRVRPSLPRYQSRLSFHRLALAHFFCRGELFFYFLPLPTLKATSRHLITASHNSAVPVTESHTTLSLAQKGAFVCTVSTHSLSTEGERVSQGEGERKQARLCSTNSIMTSHGEKENTACV